MNGAPSQARALLERARWQGKPICPRCGSARVGRITTRPIWWTCSGCRASHFTVTSDTPLRKLRFSDDQLIQAWLILKIRKRPVTASQLSFVLGCAYLSARSLMDRLVLVEAHMPEFAARLTDEIARHDTDAREPRAA